MLRITKFNHTSIAVPPDKHDKVVWFYETVLGLKKIPPPPNMSSVWWYEIGDKIIHLAFDPRFIKVTHLRHIAIEVDDINEARKHFQRFNVNIRETVAIPNYDRFFVIDPFDNQIEILGPKIGA
ncbi:MAG: VOC family protein [Chlamydiales bacterium]